MPFENWDMVHYVIVNDVIVSRKFVIQSHPSRQSASYIRRSIGEPEPRLENWAAHETFPLLALFPFIEKI